MNVIVSVGRNIGSRPMDITRWQTCQTAVTAVVSHAASLVFFKGTGSGIYLGEAEESFTMVALLKGPSYIANLRDDLSLIAGQFEQESIALTFGEPEFVGHPGKAQ
jgi:hypothetical protein